MMQNELILTTLHPGEHNTVPPNVNNLAAITKDCTVYASLNGITDGAILWLPQRSPYSIWLMRSKVGGYSVSYTSHYDASSHTINSGDGYFVPSIKPISIGPDLSTVTSAVRTYAGLLRVKSDTTSTTSAAISGEFHCAAVSDIRGLRTMSVSDLVQQTITKKDAVWNVKPADGVVAIVGSDISNDYQIPRVGLLDDTAFSAVDDTTVHIAQANPGGPASYFHAFMAPGFTFGNSTSVTTLDDFAWFDPVDYLLRFQYTGGVYTPGTKVCAEDIYAFINDADMLAYVNSVCTIFEPNFHDTTVSNNGYNYKHTGGYHWVYNTLGHNRFFYIGTCFTFLMGAATPTIYMDVIPVARSLYRQGRVGPARIIRFNNIASGQNLQISGIIRNQIIASGTIAPYASLNHDASINASLIPMLSALYNGPSQEFKRVFTGEEYDQLTFGMRETEPSSVINSAVPVTVEAEAKSAGLFGGLGGQLGSAFGPLGGVLGTIGGGLADNLLGTTSGVFSRRSSVPRPIGTTTGMWGRSAGSQLRRIEENSKVLPVNRF